MTDYNKSINFGVNLLPKEDGGGSLGSLNKYWGKLYVNDLLVNNGLIARSGINSSAMSKGNSGDILRSNGNEIFWDETKNLINDMNNSKKYGMIQCQINSGGYETYYQAFTNGRNIQIHHGMGRKPYKMTFNANVNVSTIGSAYGAYSFSVLDMFGKGFNTIYAADTGLSGGTGNTAFYIQTSQGVVSGKVTDINEQYITLTISNTNNLNLGIWVYYFFD